MSSVEIPLDFTEQQLRILFTYPNTPTDHYTLAQTIQHWFGQTLERDGLLKSMLNVVQENGKYVVKIDGPSEEENSRYATRFPGLLHIGWQAYERVEKVVKPNCKWDPSNTGKWRFFLTLGVGIVNLKTLQLFHYPPERLVDPLRDSMKDPVTARCRDLLEANKVLYDRKDTQQNQTRLYETRINSAPIAAPDNQGTPKPPYLNDVKPDPVSGSYIPVEYFNDFQMAMIQLYLDPHPTVEGFTKPMIVYGRTPRKQLVGQWMGPDCAAVIQILPQKGEKSSKLEVAPASVDIEHYLRTPVLGSNHPYLFYAIAQIDNDRKWGVGCAKLVPEHIPECLKVMQDDLAVVYWQVTMADDPSLNPWDVINEGRKHWKDDAQLLDVCALIWRQASLYYAPDDPLGNYFTFRIDDWRKARDEIKQSGMEPIEFLKTKATAAANA